MSFRRVMKVLLWIVSAMFIAWTLLLPEEAEAQCAAEDPGSPDSYVENFSATAKRHGSTTADGWLGPVTLQHKAYFSTTSDETLGYRVFAVANAGDPDDDGDHDLLVLTDAPDSSGEACHLHYLTNLWDGTNYGWDWDGDGNHGGAVNTTGGSGWELRAFTSTNCTIQGAVLLSGDIDADSTDGDNNEDFDFVLITNTDIHDEGEIARAYVYHNTGLSGIIPQLTEINRESRIDDAPSPFPFGSTSVSYHWAASPFALADFENDGYLDLLVQTSLGKSSDPDGGGPRTSPYNYRESFYFSGGSDLTASTLFEGHKWDLTDPGSVLGEATAAGTFAGNNETATSGCATSAGNYSRGITTVLAHDFDGDNDVDVVAGSMSETDLYYYENNYGVYGSGYTKPTDGDENPTFAAPETLTFAEGAGAYPILGDFDNDGDTDFIVGRDGTGCGGAGGTAWFFAYDSTGTPQFTKGSLPVINRGQDLDWGVSLDVDGDGVDDAMFGQAKWQGPYTIARAGISSYYATRNIAVSTEIDSLAASSKGITSVVINDWDVNTDYNDTNTFIEFYLSNNDGLDWERVDLTPTSTSVTHSFATYGTELRWKAVLRATAVSSLPAGQESLFPAASSTPTITEIDLDYHYVQLGRYSRSRLAQGYGSYDDTIYEATFDYPTFNAYLQEIIHDQSSVFDVGTGGLVNARDDDDTSIGKEANDRSESINPDNTNQLSGRYMKVAYEADADGKVNDLLDFTEALATNVGDSSLRDLIGISSTTDAGELVHFLRWGMDDGTPGSPKLFFDWGHSSPVFVGDPNLAESFIDPDINGDGNGDFDYATFSGTNREETIYISSNGGAVHAIDANQMKERWAIIPRNLAKKLQYMRDDSGGSGEYRHGYYADGPLHITDAYDGSNWKTLLIAGQAKGQGADSSNYYYALDVTDPTSPQALWEFTDDISGASGAACDRDTDSTVPACTTGVCTGTCDDSSCDALVSLAKYEPQPDGDIVIEAENRMAAAQFDFMVHTWDEENTVGGASEGAYLRANPVDSTNCENNNCWPSDDPCECGVEATYDIRFDEAGDYKIWLRALSDDTNDENSYGYGLDGTWIAWKHTSTSAPDDWYWEQGGTDITVTQAGLHTLHIYMREAGFQFDKIVLRKTSTSPTGSFDDETCENICGSLSCPAQTCSENERNPDTEGWPDCAGYDANDPTVGMKCCENGDNDFCQTLGVSCEDSDTVMGETWSPPVVGRFKIDGDDERYLVWFGSGNNNRDVVNNVGNTVYALDAFTGELVGKWTLADLPFSGSSPKNPSTLANAIPAGVRLVDLQNDKQQSAGFGFVDRVYITDLEGRVWRIDTSSDAGLSGGLIAANTGDNGWDPCVIFDAGAVSVGGDRRWAPIVTTPAAAVIAGKVNLYFGTGGHDDAPDTFAPDGVTPASPEAPYRFYSVRDENDVNVCPGTPKVESDLTIQNFEWVVGDNLDRDGNAYGVGDEDHEGEDGDRYWADPVVVNNMIVFFASLPGDIESVDPCDSLDGTTKFYGYALQNLQGFSTGQSIFSGADPWLASQSKVRQGALIQGSAASRLLYGAGGSYNESGSGVSTGTQGGDLSNLKVLTSTFSETGGSGGNTEAVDASSLTTYKLKTNPLRLLRWREVPL